MLQNGCLRKDDGVNPKPNALFYSTKTHWSPFNVSRLFLLHFSSQPFKITLAVFGLEAAGVKGYKYCLPLHLLQLILQFPSLKSVMLNISSTFAVNFQNCLFLESNGNGFI